MKIIKVIEKKTKNIFLAQYCLNRRGNLRYWVDGKFYSDKNFDKLFIIIN